MNQLTISNLASQHSDNKPVEPIFARHETFHPRFGWLKKGIEIAYRYLNDYYGEILDLDRIENWLPRMSRRLNCSELTLARLIWVCKHIKSIRWMKDGSAWKLI